MKARLFLLSAVALSACPTTTTPPDCATKCASVALPPSICVDANTARDFALGLGDCSETCTFVPLDRPCAGGCDQGRCVENLTPMDAGATEDAGSFDDAGTTFDAGVTTDAGSSTDDGGVNACMNVTCAAPPASVCLDATRLRIFDARGVCASGQCLYGSREEVCTAGCANGACQNNPCQGVTCSTPPVAVCTDASTLKSYAPNGTCNNGGCRYAETLTTCQFGCANGRCTNDPCAGVSCAQPPAPFCSNATTLRTFSTQGVCASGSCLYTPSDTTCRFGCLNGRCTNDPCQGVTCNQPPASACLNATTLRAFTAAGVCSGGSCLYSPVDSTCQFGCAQGACVGNPCQGVTCSTPPASTCVNATTRRTFSTSGTCSGGACSYASTDTVCQFGCTNGACVGNPCQGVTCNMAPASTCVGANTLRTFSTSGTCSNGACSYASSDTACAFGCMSGACVGNPCQGVSCNTPPAATCVNPTTLRTFSTAGTCANGACSYTAQDTTCAFGCANGACTGNPCQGVTCSTPPANTCLNATTLRTFNSRGTCSGGACSYSSADTTCPFGCAGGACTGNPCTGVTCNMPPANTCLNATTLRTFNSSGTCSGGACSYSSADTTCPFGCTGGACTGNPCTGVTCNMPPANACLNATTLRTFNASGVCSGGACSYTSQDATCPFGCAGGACTGNPCTGVTCNTPPASTCVNPTTLRSFSPSGTCSGGSCSYTAAESTCPFGCVAGACTGNPCQGVTCNTPPASTCLNPTTLRSFSSSGTCAGGACSYTPTDTTCPFGCASGACVNDPCTGVTCNMPPARTCLNPTTLRSFSPSGSCSGGGCSYAPSDMMCAFGCASGACQNDPCAGVTCTTPPATTCVGNSVRSYAATGTCTSGTCGYTFTDTACAGSCSNGACVAPTCGGTTCNSPPAPTCLNANRLRTAFPAGTCTNNTCSYTQYEVLCSQGCINGACIAGSWTVEFMPQASPPVFIQTDTIFDAAGEPIQVGCEQETSYSSYSNGTVRYRRRTSSGWLEETIDVGMGVYCNARVVLDTSGEPMAIWYDTANADLRFARRNGGTWAPKELISTNGGGGMSMVLGPSGQPWVSHSTPTTVELATRAADGTWSTETVFTSNAQTTALRLVAGEPWLLANINPITVARKTAGAWTTTALSTTSGTIKADSFMVQGNVPRLMVSDGNGWVWRTAQNGLLFNEPIGDEPVATRTGALPAVWVSRAASSSSSTPMIRVRQNDAWPDTLSTVPYATQLFRIVSYTGSNGRHIVMDASGRRLTSPNVCAPQCSGRTCGDDGCGGSCGTCATGTCAFNGTCSTLTSKIISGAAPQRAVIASGTTSVHVLEEPSSYSVWARSLSSGSFTAATRIPVSTYGVVGGHLDIVNDLPAAFVYHPSGISNVVPLQQSVAGTWSSGPSIAQTYYGGYRFDAAGNAYMVRCTTSQVYQATLPAGGTAWTPETSIITFGSSGTYQGCQFEVSPSGKVFVLYEGKLYSNTPGFTVQTVPNAGRMGMDAQGNLHMINTTGTHVWRASTSTLETDNAPPGVQMTWMAVTGDRNGQTAATYLNTSGNVVFARRTGPATWATDTLPGQALTTAPAITNGSTALYGLAFDTANAPHMLFNDRGTWRHVTK
ncbi:MAG: hypothetical protein JNM69_18180 [Archangium sp.]|nr:hypothetical protein [Archangium sp.]